MLLIVLLLTSLLQAQESYRAEDERINNLVHTKLKVGFNFEKRQLNGEAWITLTPHFYQTDKLVLDAKSFEIIELKVDGIKRNYNYSDDELTIELGQTYRKGQEYEVYVSYIAKPEEVKQQGSAAIKDAKGLYFIDPMDEDPDKPTQIWTQGETEASSCWFPTIDSPNQKTSQELYMTVPEQYVTLSNGRLVNSTDNGNGTRTDYWKMDQKHAPYLFFMGVGNFSIVEDSWNGIPVNYYVEPAYEDVAKDIFGHTPEMMTFYSGLTGIPYPWPKYSQIVVRDYVSGAMENTTAVVHAETAQQKMGQLVDENLWEATIAHELFHHWFGDLVTTESWANLTVNESFATYGVYLWYEYKYGKDKANAHMYNDIQTYLSSQLEDKDLVRFYYEDKELMFDPVSYHKGNAILHMLRDYLGDEAFFQGLQVYLKRHAYGTAEAHELRLALEEVSGRDLNWFFNQWFYGSGHIKMTVSYDYNTINRTVTVNIDQKGQLFEFPLTIDVHEAKGKSRYRVWVNKSSSNSFTFNYSDIPDLILVDPEHVLLKEASENKTEDNFIFQYKNAEHYLNRRIAIEEVAKVQLSNKEAFNTMIAAMNDPYYELRVLALSKLDLFQKYKKKEAIAKVIDLAENDKSNLVRAEALHVLGKLVDPIYRPLFEKGLKSTSYAIVGRSLTSLYQIDKTSALSEVQTLSEDIKNSMSDAITTIYINEEDKSKLPFIAKHVLKGMFFTQDQRTQQLYAQAFRWIAESDNEEAIQNLTNDFVDLGIKYKRFKFDQMGINLLNQMVSVQLQKNYSNKEDLVLILKTGIAKLVE